MQSNLDNLFSQAKEGSKFNKLMNMISSKQNILLAYRNIKSNKGSTTPGVDSKTIDDYSDMSEDEFVLYFQKKFENYIPKAVRRVEIPKGFSGKTRPLGIPCMDDRIVQQCIKQVLEPIMEAQFYNHSYGFRPNRSTKDAIARCAFMINKCHLHYVVDVDIKGFFDNVNHSKLMKQLWSLGIHDKSVLAIIKKILTSEIDGVGIPNKGTPQGGIISPLLSNVVLNELDWWIASQWEDFETKKNYAKIRKSGQIDYSHKYRALRTTNLKEVWIVRYADDFKIFCKDYQTAEKIFKAVKMWLMERLSLEISEDKSRITNLRKKYADFLGIRFKASKKNNSYVCQSYLTEKAKKSVIMKLKNQVKRIQKAPSPAEVTKLNSIIMGAHGYYNMATNVNIDFGEINYIVNRTIDIRLRSYLSNKAKPSKTYEKLYGDYKKGIRTACGVTIFPLYGVKNKPPMAFSQNVCNYTKEGREMIHKKLDGTFQHLIQHLLRTTREDVSVELRDNAISHMAGQRGRCYVTGQLLEVGNMECHHKTPRKQGGTDKYKNLVWINSEVHKLVHATNQETIEKYLNRLELNGIMTKKVNSLRKLVGNFEI
ncbi:group II intron reverse transcriptase/maturase [Clostridium perfringens]|nr:group II intron reverse transcriptase/maturase [Clostridium perfringens]